ncbi:MAG: hypothetical protein Q8L29_03845 [archaeon]|nr:hypothetical protein [archaeon]
MTKAVLVRPSLKINNEEGIGEEVQLRAHELYLRLKKILKKLEIELTMLESEKNGRFEAVEEADFLFVDTKDATILDNINFEKTNRLKGIVFIDPTTEHVHKTSHINLPKLILGSSKLALIDLERDVFKFFKKILG